MDGRKVDDVEAEIGDVIEALLAIAECPVPAGLVRRGTGKQLVPRARARARRIDDDFQLQGIRRRETAIGMAPHQLQQFIADRGRAPLFQIRVGGKRFRGRGERLRISPLGARCSSLDQRDTHLQRDRNVRRIGTLRQILPP
jgi:hypothetical protein